MEKPPVKKKKIVGVKVTRKQGEVIVKGSPTKVTQEVKRGGPRTETYTPSNKETGLKDYGPVGDGGNKEMQRLLAEARAKKRDVTAFGTTGRTKNKTYWAGTTVINDPPPIVSTHNKINPTMRKTETKSTPIYEKTGEPMGRLKPRAVVSAGHDGRGTSHNTSGIGKKKKVVIRNVKKFKSPNRG